MRSPSRSPCRELETNWGNLVKVAGEIRRHEAIILSDEEPPKAVSRSADIAARAFRKDGRVWLLAVNKTASPVKGAVSVEGFADVTFELPALGVKTHRFDSVNYDEGKAALLAAARDERFAVCVPNQTGKGGVPLGKRDFGENVFREVEMFPHWFCKAYRKYADREKSMAFDQHLLPGGVARVDLPREAGPAGRPRAGLLLDGGRRALARLRPPQGAARHFRARLAVDA